MKILINYMFCTRGGVESVLKNRLKNFERSGLEIDLLFFNDYGGKGLFEGIGRNIYFIEETNEIIQLIQKQNYDIVIVIDTPRMIEILEKMNYSGKVILEVHTTYEQSLEYLKRIKFKRIHKIIVPSEYEKDIVEKLLKMPIPIFVIPNPIDTDFFKMNNIKFNSSKKILLWIGRLDQHKNWRLFIKIANQINSAYKNEFEFWIVGGLFSDKNEIGRMYKDLFENDLYNCFKFIPKVEQGKMPNIYNYVAKSKGAYILTSNDESFGMTIIEALACGCPVIMKDICVGREFSNMGAKINILDKECENIFEILKYYNNESIVTENRIWIEKNFNIDRVQLAYFNKICQE